MAQAITFVLRERGFRAGPLPRRLPVVRRLRRADGALRRGEVRRERARVRRAPGRRRGDRHAELALRGGGAPAAEPRAGRAGADGVAAQLVRRADPPGARRRPGAAGRALSDGPPRSYLRVFPTDDLQGAALALLARDRGRRARLRPRRRRAGLRRADGGRLRDGRGAARAARRGPGALGSARRATTARSPGGSRRRAPRRSSSAGCSTRTPRAVVRDLRAALGPDAGPHGPDGLTPLGAARRAGRRRPRDGVLVSLRRACS